MHIRKIRKVPSWWKRLKSFFCSKPKPPPKKSRWMWYFLGFMMSICAGVFVYSMYFLPSVENAAELQFSESTVIYDRGALNPENDPNDHVLYVIHGDENREYVPLEEIPQWMIDATISIEDDQFYHHIGFDIGGIVKAVLNRYFRIGTARGGSTITQQLVKNSFLTREKTVVRKFNEILLSMKVEWYYTKNEILEMYLNKIPYGHNAHGVEAAAKTFFGKSVRELTIAESTVLASLPVAPTRFSPYGSNKNLLMGFYEVDEASGEKVFKKGRKDLVLQRMLDLKKITFEEFKTAWAEANEIKFKTYRTDIRAPHFVFYVREKLEEKYGKEMLKQGGFKIYTTLDPNLQELAEKTISDKTAHYEATYGAKNAALISINPDNGQILSFVGGKDYFDTPNDGQVNILTARRQPGSSFKPLVYTAAFEQGYAPSTVVFDVETDFGGNYKPQNFDGNFLGPVSLRDSLNRSLNIPSIKAAYLADPKNILKLAEKVGIKYEGDASFHGIALGVGVAEVEPLSHINSFQVFARDGSFYDPSAILEIHDVNGEVLEVLDVEKNKKEGPAAEMVSLVRHIITDETTRPTTEGFDWNKLLQLGKWDNGAKTGTSNRSIENPEFNEEEEEDDEENPKNITVPGDSWTIGFTPHLVAGVWVGNNRGEPMKPGATGLAVAAPIWKKFMLDAHEILIENGIDVEKTYPDVELESRKVNKFSGKLATDLTPPKLVREEVFAPSYVPNELDDSVEQVEIDKISGRKVSRFTPLYSRTQKHVLKLASVRPNMLNWAAPVEEWIKEHPRFMSSLGMIMDSEEDIEKDKEKTDENEAGIEKESPRYRVSTFAPLSERSRIIVDDVHNAFTQKNAPNISILSPRNGGSLAPGEVEVRVAASAKFGMKGVEYYFDDVLISESLKVPWEGRFRIPKSVKLGSTHIIRAVAIDQLLNIGEAEIEIRIEGDQDGPDIVFWGPLGNQRIPLNSMGQILADIKDYESRVKRVEFLFDDVVIGEKSAPPYQQNFTANGKLGKHFIKVRAWDEYDNLTEKSIVVHFVREKLVRESEPVISKVTTLRNVISVDLIFPKPSDIAWAEIVMSQGENVLYMHRFEPVGRSAQFHIPKNTKGKAYIQLYTKQVKKSGVTESVKKEVSL